MASAEKLLNEAQYAFNSIGPGGSRGDRRNASRASRLARKIIRKYPASSEAAEARSILKRLGEEAFAPRLPLMHGHAGHSESQRTPESPSATTMTSVNRAPTGKVAQFEDTVALDWSGLLSVILATPRILLGVILVAGLFLFNLFGWFLLLPILLLVFLVSPARSLLQRKQRNDINAVVIRANEWIDRKIRDGGGLS
ncbi:MAG: hypothetical protein QNI96_13770 [Woeseiaceae bacterium]|nr:hypothetical protein [Woeseiaceae bacterium]